MSLQLVENPKQLILPGGKDWLPKEEWEPLYWSKPKYTHSRGEDIADFAESALKITRGEKIGQPFELTEWQKWAMKIIFEEKDDGRLRYRRFLLGLPRKNGKSLLGTAIALEHLFYGDESTQVYSVAKNRIQAKIVFKEAQKQVNASPVLQKVLKVYRDKIVNKVTGGIYEAVSSDAGSFQGTGPSLVIADEMHAWLHGQAEEFWAALNKGSGDRPESLVLGITTAGENFDSLLGRLYESNVKSIEEDNRETLSGMIWWAAPEDADVYDFETWKQANPNLAEGILSEEEIKGDFAADDEMGSLNDFKRYRLNQWVRVDGKDSYITPGHWKNAEKTDERIEKGSRICVGFDGSLSEDSTGFIGIDMETGLLEVLAVWEKDLQNPEWVVPRDEVIAAKNRIFEEYDVAKMWCDDAFFQTDVQKWAKEHRGRVERIPQSNARMVPMTEQMKIDLISGQAFHNGDPVLRKHFLNAVQDHNGKISKDKRGSKRKIDLAVCSILANGARNRVLGRGRAIGRAISLS